MKHSIQKYIRTLSVLVLAFICIQISADENSVKEALKVAREFAMTKVPVQVSTRRMASVFESSPQVAHIEKSKATDMDNVYVINYGQSNGFVIISGESTESEVLGYCDHGSFSYDSCPAQLRSLIGSYSQEVETVRQNQRFTVPRRAKADMGSIIVGPLLTTTWSQWSILFLFII